MNYISTNILYIQYFPQTLLHPFGKRQCIEANAATFPDIVLLKDQKRSLVDRQPMMSAFIWATPQMTFPGCFCGWKAFDYKDCCFINFSANVFLQIFFFFINNGLSLCLCHTAFSGTNNTLWTSLLRGPGECKCWLTVILLQTCLQIVFSSRIDEHKHEEPV